MNDLADLYKIGTVAKLTGIAVERLRAWERRYGLTPASRDGKTRYFSGEQVDRLTRIKHLIDQGHPVSTLINLDNTALNERLQSIASSPTADGATTAVPNVALIGTQLLMLEQNLPVAARFNVMGRWVNLGVCLPRLEELQTAAQSRPAANVPPAEDQPPPPDVVVILVGSVTPEALQELTTIPAPSKVLVVYHYATEAGLASAAERDQELLRWPVQWSDIEAAVARLASTPLRAGHRAGRHFSDEQLLTIASTGSGLGCACPADLVHLISALNAFSDHSAACAVPGTDGPTPLASPRRGTLARHRQIAERTSQARLELELVLEEWVQAEGLLPAPN